MLREIRLYGELGRRFGRVHRYHVDTPAEALRALRANYGGRWDRYMFEQRDAPFRVLLDDAAIDAERMRQPIGPEVFKIVPVICGASSDAKAIASIVIGAALIYFAGPFGAYTDSVLGFGGATAASAVGAVGLGLALSGVSRLLFKPPGIESTEPTTNLPSYSFANGAVNTVGQGNPVPVGYGRVFAGSQQVSFGMFAEDR